MNRSAPKSEAKIELAHPERSRIRKALRFRNQSFQLEVLEQLRQLEQLYGELVSRLDSDGSKKTAFEHEALTLPRAVGGASPKELKQRTDYAESCLFLADYLADVMTQTASARHDLAEEQLILGSRLAELRDFESALSERDRQSAKARNGAAELSELSETEERFSAQKRG